MAVNVLGRAYIEVHADTKSFARELKDEVTAISTVVEKSANTSGRSVGKSLSEGIERETTKETPNVVRRIFSVFDREGSKNRSGNFFTRFLFGDLLGGAEKAGKDSAASFSKSFTSSLGDLLSGAASGPANLVKSIGSSVGNVGGSGPLAGIVGLAVILGIPAIIGAVIALINVLGPLINVIGLLPGALALAGAAIIPVVVAFQGFGEAVSAIASGDIDKINAALKNLAPAAVVVAKDVASILPFFKELKRVAQNAFFFPLEGQIQKVVAALGPTFLKGFAEVANSAGKFAKNILDLVYDPKVQQFFADAFLFASTAFDTLADPVKNLLGALSEIADESFPFIQILLGLFGDLVNDFATFLDNNVRNGEFQGFLNDFMDALVAAKELGASTINLIKALLGGPDEQAKSQEFFDLLITVIDTLTSFFQSDDGRKAIQGMIDLGEIFLIVLGGMVILFGKALVIVEAIVSAMRWILTKIGVLNAGTAAAAAAASVANQATLPGHASGGIFNNEHVARIAEGGRPEVVIPLTDRKRAQQLADQSGLSQMLGTSQPVVNVYIGDEQISARVDQRVALGIRGLTSSMTYGPRPVGVGG